MGNLLKKLIICFMIMCSVNVSASDIDGLSCDYSNIEKQKLEATILAQSSICQGKLSIDCVKEEFERVFRKFTDIVIKEKKSEKYPSLHEDLCRVAKVAAYTKLPHEHLETLYHMKFLYDILLIDKNRKYEVIYGGMPDHAYYYSLSTQQYIEQHLDYMLEVAKSYKWQYWQSIVLETYGRFEYSRRQCMQGKQYYQEGLKVINEAINQKAWLTDKVYKLENAYESQKLGIIGFANNVSCPNN